MRDLLESAKNAEKRKQIWYLLNEISGFSLYCWERFEMELSTWNFCNDIWRNQNDSFDIKWFSWSFIEILELLHNRGTTHVKIFSGNDPLGVKICGKSEFDIFEAKKRFRRGVLCIEAKSRKNAIFA
jgi:hypothetical protein